MKIKTLKIILALGLFFSAFQNADAFSFRWRRCCCTQHYQYQQPCQPKQHKKQPQNAPQSRCSGGQCSVPKKTVAENDYQNEVVRLVNIERKRFGLNALKINDQLQNKSEIHCRFMANFRRFQHSGGVAENIAQGQRTPQEVVRCWMNSAGHRANILNPRHNEIGVGFFKNFWTQQFK